MSPLLSGVRNAHKLARGDEFLANFSSSEEQRERETIEIQREFLQEYCRLYALEVVQIYADDGVSGTVPLHERPEGRRLLEDAKEGKFSTLLVYRLDRLGRSLLVTVDAHDRLQACGVALKSATEPIDTSSPSGRLIFQMLASFAEYERETIRERTQAGLQRAYRGGKHFGAAPAPTTAASSRWCPKRQSSCVRSSRTSPKAPRSTRRPSA
jgi:DNA invertase Pin-like site-specific DNA recombinase